jgi:hypothetical protein
MGLASLPNNKKIAEQDAPNERMSGRIRKIYNILQPQK